jgi:limonene-1,2-epoxide hydrolase
MSEEQVKSNIRAFLAALQAKDTDKALSLVTEDSVWETPNGTFKGKAGIKRYITWTDKMTPDFKVTESGMGVISQGNIGVIEHTLSGTYEGKKWQQPAICIYEFDGDKIKNMRTFSDRLDLANQVARGPLARGAVTAIINAMQEGLDSD